MMILGGWQLERVCMTLLLTQAGYITSLVQSKMGEIKNSGLVLTSEVR